MRKLLHKITNFVRNESDFRNRWKVTLTSVCYNVEIVLGKCVENLWKNFVKNLQWHSLGIVKIFFLFLEYLLTGEFFQGYFCFGRECKVNGCSYVYFKQVLCFILSSVLSCFLFPFYHSWSHLLKNFITQKLHFLYGGCS